LAIKSRGGSDAAARRKCSANAVHFALNVRMLEQNVVWAIDIPGRLCCNAANSTHSLSHKPEDFIMRQHRIRQCFASAMLLPAVLAITPALAQMPYDGLWNVTIVTKTGSCEPQARSTITVTEGKVSAPGAEVSGSVGREGNVRVSIRGTYANGQLSGNAGSGKWNGASGGVPCSGRWEASRQ
jgi:hypothetical protein